MDKLPILKALVNKQLRVSQLRVSKNGKFALVTNSIALSFCNKVQNKRLEPPKSTIPKSEIQIQNKIWPFSYRKTAPRVPGTIYKKNENVFSASFKASL